MGQRPVYTSDTLIAPGRIAGEVFVRLFASSSAEDTDFTAKLVDVEPNGYAANVTEGKTRRSCVAKSECRDFLFSSHNGVSSVGVFLTDVEEILACLFQVRVAR